MKYILGLEHKGGNQIFSFDEEAERAATIEEWKRLNPRVRYLTAEVEDAEFEAML